MQTHRDVDLNLFIVFEALLRHRHVSRAADELGLSQGSVSKALAKLRQHFGDMLFLKTRDGVTPTDKALALAPDVARFVAFADQTLIARRPFDPLTADRIVRLGTTDMAELALMPILVERLRAIAPRCQITAIDTPGTEAERLEAGEIDLVLTGPLKTRSEIRQQKLFEHRYVVIVHRDCPLEHEITLEQFSAMDLVMVPPTRSHSITVTETLARQGLRPRAAVTTMHWLVVPHVVGANPTFTAIVPHSLAALYGGFAHVKALEARFELPKIELLQFWHARSDGDEFNVWLRTQVREALYKTPALHLG